MINSFLNRRRLGQLKSTQAEQSKIISNFNETKQIVQLQQFSHKQMRSYDGPSTKLAVDSSGQHVLIGSAASFEDFFVQSFNVGSSSCRQQPKTIIKYQELAWKDLDYSGLQMICRLQFVPNGKDIYAVSLNKTIQIVDTTTNQVTCGIDRGLKWDFWSDWHPNDRNLIATCGSRALNLVDIRQRSAKSAVQIFRVREANQNPISCLWFVRDDNYLIVTDVRGHINTYDKRNLRKIELVNNVHLKLMNDLQMTPDGKYLFGWCKQTRVLTQLQYDKGNVAHKNTYRPGVWKNDDKWCYADLQFHTSDTHLFLPMKSTDWMPDESNRSTIQVIDVETGEKVNDINAVSRGYNSMTDSDEYARVDAVVGLTNGHHEHQLYTLNDRCELGIWSFSGAPQEETRMRSLELERETEQHLEFKSQHPSWKNDTITGS